MTPASFCSQSSVVSTCVTGLRHADPGNPSSTTVVVPVVLAVDFNKEEKLCDVITNWVCA